MYKFTLSLMLSTLFLMARYEAYPTQTCPAFNNMKHTQNSGNLYLDTNKKYTILHTHKGQKLLLIKGVNPAQRWVDASCFAQARTSLKPFKTVQSDTSKTKRSTHNLLALSWHNAFCQTHRKKRECRRPLVSFKPLRGDSRFVLHGLWPQPKNRQYCNVDKYLVGADKNGQWHYLPCLALEESTQQTLQEVMPGVASDLHKHEWVKHGTCYGTGVEQYFQDSIDLVEQIRGSSLEKLFQANEGKRVNLKAIRQAVNSSFGSGSGNSVELRCKGGLITEVWFHLHGEGSELKSLLKSSKIVRSRCQSGLIDSAGF
jgi:ribonuclease T2